jgi:crotonobetainyl-CoA:carnitine CoA-transferase CaiB-like acyl-CoA transferase
MILADMGADVIRIEEPEGAADRSWGQLGPDGETLLYKIIARNKRSITLRLNTLKGKEIFRELVKRSDIVLHNFTPGSLIADEVRYERLKEINTSIIVVSVSGYGQNGPDAAKPCFDAVAQARSGGMILTGFPGTPPLKTTVTYVDVATGLFATVGVLLALRHKEKTGQGQAIDTSLFDTAVFATQALGALLLYKIYGDIRKQVGNRGFHSYIGCFEARDGWVLIAPATNTIWKRFAKAIGRRDLASDPRFISDIDRFNNAGLIDLVVKEWITLKTAGEVVNLLHEARVPCSVINTVDKLLTDPQVEAREMIKYVDYPELGKIPVPSLPVKLSLTPSIIKTPAPKLGEHNEEVYCGLLGLAPEELSRLKRENII